MTRILNEEQREDVGGEREEQRGKKERETMTPAPTETNNSSPNLKPYVLSSTSGSRRFNTPLSLSSVEEQTRTSSHYEKHRYSCSVLLLLFCLFSPCLICVMNIMQHVVLQLRGLHFHIMAFLGNWKIGCYCPVFFFLPARGGGCGSCGKLHPTAQ